jgi:pimeloyl-ACP methyl ester carboxylesterase
LVHFNPHEIGCTRRGLFEQRLVCAEGKTRLSARYLPAHVPDSTPLVALHGISRNARSLWRAFAPLAQRTGRALLVPRFDPTHWTHFQQIGRARADLALLGLVRQTSMQGQRFDLFGFSGGAQLALRFAMLYPHRVACLHLAAPGWYCLPDRATGWPQGLGPVTEQRLRRFDPAALCRLQLQAFLALPMRLWFGSDDVQRDDSLRQSPQIDAQQGLTRHDRAQHYATAFASAARTHNIVPDIALSVLPGCGHDFTQCARVGGLATRVTNATPLTLTNNTKDF